MRNLKRALSLAMATFMLLGMMVVGAGAVSISDFSDGEKIVNQEAVTVLTTLGVLAGRDDGSFDPEGTVTRGEMAKMICVILNGGRDPQLGETIKNSYTDTVGHWASAYIEYCTTLGIIAGRNDGTFDPNGTVTVAEAGKMILVALGYNAGVEGYVGANWQINTDVRANALGLYDELETLNTNVALTRDNAAQICYNALDEKMVEYSYIITGTQDNSISTKPQLNDSKKGTLLYDKFGAYKVKGVVVANEYADLESDTTNSEKAKGVVGSSLDAGKTKIIVTNAEEQDAFDNKSYTFSTVTGEEELGKTVWMFVKPSSTSLKSTVIGSAIISDDNTIVTDASGDTAKAAAEDENLDIVEGKTQYAYNYAQLSDKTSDAYNGKVGVEKTIVDTNGDGDVDYVLYKELGLGKVAVYSEAKDGQIVISVNDGNHISKNKDSVIGFDEVEKDNYVLSAYIGGRLYVQVAETVTGKIDAYKQTGSAPTYRTTGYTIDGETYTVSRVKSVGGDLTVATTSVDKTILGNEATFYLDLNGNVVAFGEVDQSAYKFAYIWGAEGGSSIGTDRVKATLEDGTEKTFDLSGSSDVDVAKDGEPGINDRTVVHVDDMQGKVYAYTLTSGGDIKLYFPKGGAVTQEDPQFTNGLTNIRFAGDPVPKANDVPELSPKANEEAVRLDSTYYSNNATTFFYVTMKDADTVKSVDVYNGRTKAPSVDGTQGEALLALRNTAGDVGAAVFTGVNVTASAGDHMFIYNANYVWDEYGYVDAFLNGATEPQTDVKVALYEDGDIVHNPDVDDGIYLFKSTSKGYYEITKPVSTTPYYFTGTVLKVDSNSNTFVILNDNGGFQTEVRMDDKSVVIDYDADDSAPIAYTNSSVAAGDTVQVIVNNDNDRRVLMVGIMDRKDMTNPDDPTVGTTTNTYGNIAVTAPNNAAPVSARVVDNQLTFTFKAPTGYAADATVNFSYRVSVDNVLMDADTVDDATLNGSVINQVATGYYTTSDSIKVVVTDVVASAYTVKGAGNVTTTTTALSSGTAAPIIFTVKGLAGVSKTTVNYTISGVAGTGVTGGKYTGTKEIAVNNGVTANITTTDSLTATGPVTVTVNTTATGEVPVTYKVTGATGFTVTDGTASLTTDAAVGGDLANLTITKPANVASFDYQISVNGLKATPTIAKVDDATADATVNVSPFDAGTTKSVATGPVTVTVAISDVVTNYKAGAVDITDITTSANFTFDSITLTVDADIPVGSTGSVTGDFASGTVTALDPGTVTLTVLAGAKLVGETATVDVERGATTFTIPNITLNGFDGKRVIFAVAFTAATEYAIAWDSALDSAAVVGTSTDKYSITGITAGADDVDISGDKNAVESETVTVTITGAKTGGTWADTGTIGLAVDGKIVGTPTVLSDTGTVDFTFEMPAKAVTLTLVYTPAPVSP